MNILTVNENDRLQYPYNSDVAIMAIKAVKSLSDKELKDFLYGKDLTIYTDLVSNLFKVTKEKWLAEPFFISSTALHEADRRHLIPEAEIKKYFCSDIYVAREESIKYEKKQFNDTVASLNL